MAAFNKISHLKNQETSYQKIITSHKKTAIGFRPLRLSELVVIYKPSTSAVSITYDWNDFKVALAVEEFKACL